MPLYETEIVRLKRVNNAYTEVDQSYHRSQVLPVILGGAGISGALIPSEETEATVAVPEAVVIEAMDHGMLAPAEVTLPIGIIGSAALILAGGVMYARNKLRRDHQYDWILWQAREELALLH